MISYDRYKPDLIVHFQDKHRDHTACQKKSSTFIMVPIMSYPISRPECINFLRETSGFFRTISPVAALVLIVLMILIGGERGAVSLMTLAGNIVILFISILLKAEAHSVHSFLISI